jgi:hypothetical protein
MKRPKQSANQSQLLQAIKTINTVLSKDGQIYETHVRLENNWASAQTQILSIGEKITEDLNACPNAHTLEAALAKCGQSVSITQLDTKLSIKSDKFRALVPCLPSENLPRAYPDPPVAALDDRLKASLLAVAPLALDENSVVTASVLIHAGTVTATDRKVIIQSWHGIDLPPNLAIPKAVINPLIKNAKKLKAFGFSRGSVTFHFEDDSWLKSQMMAEQWPDVSRILDRPCNAWPLPEDFYIGVKSLEPFSEDGFVHFDANKMLSHSEESLGASYEVYGLPKGPAFNIKQLKMIEPFAQKVDFLADGPNGKCLMFFGDKVRGMIAGRV